MPSKKSSSFIVTRLATVAISTAGEATRSFAAMRGTGSARGAEETSSAAAVAVGTFASSVSVSLLLLAAKPLRFAEEPPPEIGRRAPAVAIAAVAGGTAPAAAASAAAKMRRTHFTKTREAIKTVATPMKFGPPRVRGCGCVGSCFSTSEGMRRYACGSIPALVTRSYNSSTEGPFFCSSKVNFSPANMSVPSSTSPWWWGAVVSRSVARNSSEKANSRSVMHVGQKAILLKRKGRE